MNLKFDKLRIAAARDVLAPTSPVVSDLLDDIETLQERVHELEERILNIAFKYPEDGTSTLSEFYQMAREVLNKK